MNTLLLIPLIILSINATTNSLSVDTGRLAGGVGTTVFGSVLIIAGQLHVGGSGPSHRTYGEPLVTSPVARLFLQSGGALATLKGCYEGYKSLRFNNKKTTMQKNTHAKINFFEVA